jgi:hypothetical protein
MVVIFSRVKKHNELSSGPKKSSEDISSDFSILEDEVTTLCENIRC